MSTESATMESKSGREVNREHYESLSAGRDDYWRKMAAPRFRVAKIRELLAQARPSTVVDLGCGNGRLLEEISARLSISRLAGVDLSSAQIESNRERDANVDWYCLDLEEPLPVSLELAGQFDVVVASEIIEHVEHPDQFLARANELARPDGGALILSTQSGPVRETERRVGHVRHFTAGEVRSLLVAAGWSPVRVWNCGFPFHDLSKWYANRNPDRSMARFGNHRYGPWESCIAALLRAAFSLNSRHRGAQLFALARRDDANSNDQL